MPINERMCFAGNKTNIAQSCLYVSATKIGVFGMRI